MAQIEVNVTANGAQLQEAWLWRLCREFNVQVILKKANVDSDFSWVQVELDGTIEEMQRAISWLMTTGMHIEALSRAVGA